MGYNSICRSGIAYGSSWLSDISTSKGKKRKFGNSRTILLRSRTNGAKQDSTRTRLCGLI